MENSIFDLKPHTFGSSRLLVPFLTSSEKKIILIKRGEEMGRGEMGRLKMGSG
jgi:hypothetical protein